ncbi:ferrous iron transporter B, partial [Lysobacter sp. ISL-42]
AAPAASAVAAPVVAPTAAIPVPVQAVAVEPAAADARAAVTAQASSAPGQERIELARAYLDLGDESSARQLLGEVLINGDHAARQQAARLLRELEASS